MQCGFYNEKSHVGLETSTQKSHVGHETSKSHVEVKIST